MLLAQLATAIMLTSLYRIHGLCTYTIILYFGCVHNKHNNVKRQTSKVGLSLLYCLWLADDKVEVTSQKVTWKSLDCPYFLRVAEKHKRPWGAPVSWYCNGSNALSSSLPLINLFASIIKWSMLNIYFKISLMICFALFSFSLSLSRCMFCTFCSYSGRLSAVTVSFLIELAIAVFLFLQSSHCYFWLFYFYYS